MKPLAIPNLDMIRPAVAERTADLDRLGVTSLAVFGSVARKEARPESDVDVLVDFQGGATLSRFMELKSLLETAFERRVHLVTPNGLRDRPRPAVEKDAIRIA